MDFQTKLQPQPVCYCHGPHCTTQPPKYIYPCLTFIFFLLIIILIAILIGPSILISLHHPLTPIVDLSSFKLYELNTSPTTPLVTSDATIKFSFTNPNDKTTILYENVKVCAYYKRYPLRCTLVQSFVQGTRTQIGMIAKMHVETKLMSRYMELQMARELISSGGLEEVGVQVGVRAWFDPGSSGVLGWGWQDMWILCKNVTLRFSSNGDGTLLSEPSRCYMSRHHFRGKISPSPVQ